MRERFRPPRGQKLRKESRTIPVHGSFNRGDGKDSGVWYRCWNCGFLCKVGRDELGDSQSRSGVIHEDYAQTPDPGFTAPTITAGIAPNNMTATMDGLVVGEQDSAGDSKGVRNAIMVSEKSKGCPLCHSLNWRGDY